MVIRFKQLSPVASQIIVALVFSGAACVAAGQVRPAPDASPHASASPAPSPANSLQSYQVRLANASTVKVMTNVLGVELGMSLPQAHQKLDKHADRRHPPKEEKEEDEGEGKVLWQLAGTPFATVFIKTGEHERINSITGTLRPGKEIPFEKIGEVKKAPVRDANTVLWDVVRPNQPLFRVVAKGVDGKANTITIFVVERPEARGGN